MDSISQEIRYFASKLFDSIQPNGSFGQGKSSENDDVESVNHLTNDIVHAVQATQHFMKKHFVITFNLIYSQDTFKENVKFLWSIWLSHRTNVFVKVIDTAAIIADAFLHLGQTLPQTLKWADAEDWFAEWFERHLAKEFLQYGGWKHFQNFVLQNYSQWFSFVIGQFKQDCCNTVNCMRNSPVMLPLDDTDFCRKCRLQADDEFMHHFIYVRLIDEVNTGRSMLRNLLDFKIADTGSITCNITCEIKSIHDSIEVEEIDKTVQFQISSPVKEVNESCYSNENYSSSNYPLGSFHKIISSDTSRFGFQKPKGIKLNDFINNNQQDNSENYFSQTTDFSDSFNLQNDNKPISIEISTDGVINPPNKDSFDEIPAELNIQVGGTNNQTTVYDSLDLNNASRAVFVSESQNSAPDDKVDKMTEYVDVEKTSHMIILLHPSKLLQKDNKLNSSQIATAKVVNPPNEDAFDTILPELNSQIKGNSEQNTFNDILDITSAASDDRSAASDDRSAASDDRSAASDDENIVFDKVGDMIDTVGVEKTSKMTVFSHPLAPLKCVTEVKQFLSMNTIEFSTKRNKLSKEQIFFSESDTNEEIHKKFLRLCINNQEMQETKSDFNFMSENCFNTFKVVVRNIFKNYLAKDLNTHFSDRIQKGEPNSFVSKFTHQAKFSLLIYERSCFFISKRDEKRKTKKSKKKHKKKSKPKFRKDENLISSIETNCTTGSEINSEDENELSGYCDKHYCEPFVERDKYKYKDEKEYLNNLINDL